MSTIETGWVIEVGNSTPSNPLYWAGKHWSYIDSEAVRFCRKEDAEKVNQTLPGTNNRICEHQWG